MKASRALESILAICVTGLLWALGCLGIVTIGPSTAAMFGVYADWEPGHDPPSVWSTFWTRFRRHFRQALGIGLGLLGVLVLLVIDAWYGLAAENAPMRPVVLAAAIFGGVLVMGVTVFLFPVLVTFPDGWRRALRNAALFAAGYVWTTLTGLFAWGVTFAVIYWFPPLLPFAIAFAAFAVARLTGRAFERYLLHRAGRDIQQEDAAGDSGEPETYAGDGASPGRDAESGALPNGPEDGKPSGAG